MDIKTTGLFNIRKLGYRQKLLIAIISIVFVSISILTINRLYLVQRFTLELIVNRLQSIGTLLVQKAQDKIRDGNIQALSTIIDFAESQEDIVFIHITDETGLVLMSSHESFRETDTMIEDLISAQDGDDNVLIQHFPMRIGQNIRGSMVIGFSLTRYSAYMSEALYWAVFLDLFMMIAVGLVSWIVSGLLINPLSEMRAVSRKIAHGDFSARIPITAGSGDVVDELAIAMNEMAEQLGDLNQNMNQKIENSTRELKENNAKLIDLSRELVEKNKKLRELDQIKTDFVAMASHEFRTPLTSIIGFAQSLKKLDLDSISIKRYLGVIEEQGQHLAHLVQNFLDVSKIETGVFHFNKTRFSLKELIERTVPVLHLKPEINCTFEDNADKSGMLYMIADENAIRQVIMNLLDNSSHFSADESKIDITVKNEPDGITVSVQDYGPGIEDEYLPHLFEKFRRGQDSVSKSFKGSGLGLAICREIIKAHGGRIWHETPEECGARFCFFIPSGDTNVTGEQTVEMKDHIKDEDSVFVIEEDTDEGSEDSRNIDHLEENKHG